MIKGVEKKMNLIMLLVNITLPIVGFPFVLIFINGNSKDAICFIVAIAGILIKIFEKFLRIYAKYFYVSVVPLFGGLIM